MYKISLIALFLVYSLHISAQHEIKETDTTLRYKEKIYSNGLLNIAPSYKYFDSILNTNRLVTKEEFDLNVENIDTAIIVLFKEGTWRFEYQKKKKNYYYLAYYEDDELIGKRYDFDSKERLISTFTRYPRMKDSTFNGSQIIEYNKKGKITKIKYIQFIENQTPLFYWNVLQFNKKGVLTSYSLTDEAQNRTRFITYSKEGQILQDYKRDVSEWYDKKWNKKQTKLKEIIYKKGYNTIRHYRNNKLVREKIK